MNDYGFIDYRKPTVKQNDYRTSTYRGHIHLVEQIPTRNAGRIENVCHKFLRDKCEEEKLKSEVQEQYTSKSIDPFLIRNPTCKDIKNMKKYEESHLRQVPKPMKPVSSVFKCDYEWKPKPYEEKPPPLITQSAVEPSSKILVPRGKPSYSKFLDPAATTTNLTFIPYTPEQLTIAAKDNITFWNFKKEKKNVFRIKEPMCPLFRSAECVKRRAEFTSKVKCVPHSGLTTEVRSNYVQNLKGLNFDITHIKNKLMSCPEPPMKADTSNNIYGSGNRIQKYIQ